MKKNKKHKILIYNDNARRDLLTITLLKNELIRRGHKVKISNPDLYLLDIYNFKPNIFLAARADHSSLVRNIAEFADVFIIPGEGGHMTKETMLSVFLGRSYWKLEDCSWISGCFLWSNRTKNWLIESKMLKESQLKVVGNPRLDIYKSKNYYDLKRDNDYTIGIAFSAKAVSTYFGKVNHYEYFFNYPYQNFPILNEDNDGYEDIIWRDHAIAHKAMMVLKQILEKTNFKIIVRPGPFEDHREFKFLSKLNPERLSVDYKSSLPEFISKTDSLITCWSTVGLEYLICKKPVISLVGLFKKEKLFRMISEKASGFKTFVNFYHQPSNIEDIIDLLNDLKNNNIHYTSNINNTKLTELLNETYNFFDSGLATNKICDEIENFVPTKNKKYNPNKMYFNTRNEKFVKKYWIIPKIIIVILYKLYFNIYVYPRYQNPEGIRMFRTNYDSNLDKFLKLIKFN